MAQSRSSPLMNSSNLNRRASVGVTQKLVSSAAVSQQSARPTAKTNSTSKANFIDIDYQSTNILSQDQLQSNSFQIKKHMQKSRFLETESQVIREARELKGKLIQMKKKKEHQNTQLVKAELTEIYNQKFEEFKKRFEEYFEDQLTAIELAKELRVTEIVDVQNQAKMYMEKLDNQQKILNEHLKDLEINYDDAMSFLKEQEQGQLREREERVEKELQERVENYKQNIDIE